MTDEQKNFEKIVTELQMDVHDQVAVSERILEHHSKFNDKFDWMSKELSRAIAAISGEREERKDGDHKIETMANTRFTKVWMGMAIFFAVNSFGLIVYIAKGMGA